MSDLQTLPMGAKLRVGFQTIAFGPRFPTRKHLEQAMDIVAHYGFQGVEFAQRPGYLGVGSVGELLEVLKQRELQFLGLAGGTLSERLEFCDRDRSRFPNYLYLEDWRDEYIDLLTRREIRLAVHPHVFKSSQGLADALSLLDRYDDLWFLPDTAHLTIAGHDIVKAIRKTLKRIAAIHFKDWTPEFGRSSHQYARGFVELGKGTIDFDVIVKELRRLHYSGWIIVELDRPSIDVESSARDCAEWLGRRDLMPKPPKDSLGIGYPQEWAFVPTETTWDSSRVLELLREMSAASSDSVDTCYNRIVCGMSRLFDAKLATLWTCTPAEDLMSLVASSPNIDVTEHSLTCCEVLSGKAIREQSVTSFDLTEKENSERFGHPDLLRKLHLTRMLSVPLLNGYNPNHVHYILNVFPSEDSFVPTQDELFCLGHDIAAVAEMALGNLLASAEGRTNYLRSASRNSSEFLASLSTLIADVVDCEAVGTFLVNDLGTRLELVGPRRTRWKVPSSQQHYSLGEGLTGKVWSNNQILLSPDARKEAGCRMKSTEIVDSQDRFSVLIAPLNNYRREVIGVVRCRNKRALGASSGSFRAFSDDDAAVVEAVNQAAVQHLEYLISVGRRNKSQQRLTHVLKEPLVGMQNLVQAIQYETVGSQPFEFDFPGDIMSWCSLMRQLISEADLLDARPASDRGRAEFTFLVKDVIAPAVRQTESLLSERGLGRAKINYAGCLELPRMLVDRNQFHQVFFNLLANAIKQFDKDSGVFKVEITGRQLGKQLKIQFRDWGPGIASEDEEIIFEEGVRGSGASERDVGGEGLGLWLVRDIVTRHGGTIHVSSLSSPTEFTILLPASLAYKAPPGL